mmetsp:Transcript_23063/g.64791  ORF Transcript_23063/g.64791 Transcript_23063/m.64791 type:complete len:234 (+) Transcript_23063:468-1169(+)
MLVCAQEDVLQPLHGVTPLRPVLVGKTGQQVRCELARDVGAGLVRQRDHLFPAYEAARVGRRLAGDLLQLALHVGHQHALQVPHRAVVEVLACAPLEHAQCGDGDALQVRVHGVEASPHEPNELIHRELAHAELLHAHGHPLQDGTESLDRDPARGLGVAVDLLEHERAPVTLHQAAQHGLCRKSCFALTQQFRHVRDEVRRNALLDALAARHPLLVADGALGYQELHHVHQA